MIVFVLFEESEWGVECLGVFSDYHKAEQDKFAIIRERFHIPLDEVADADLDDEISDPCVTYKIVKRKVI